MHICSEQRCIALQSCSRPQPGDRFQRRFTCKSRVLCFQWRRSLIPRLSTAFIGFFTEHIRCFHGVQPSISLLYSPFEPPRSSIPLFGLWPACSKEATRTRPPLRRRAHTTIGGAAEGALLQVERDRSPVFFQSRKPPTVRHAALARPTGPAKGRQWRCHLAGLRFS
jgi:hypothetical protein